MTRPPISLQDLRRRIYAKAKAEPSWRFWGLYVHVCKKETLHEAYRLAKKNDGAPGVDGVTFEAIEESGVEAFLEQIRDELVSRPYVPMREPEEGDPEGRRQESPRARDSLDPGPRGPGCAEAHPGADLRGRLPTGVVWLPAEADGA